MTDSFPTYEPDRRFLLMVKVDGKMHFGDRFRTRSKADDAAEYLSQFSDIEAQVVDTKLSSGTRTPGD